MDTHRHLKLTYTGAYFNSRHAYSYYIVYLPNKGSKAKKMTTIHFKLII